MRSWRARRSARRRARSRWRRAALAPPKVEDDQQVYERRSLSMTWTRGRRELAISGRLPLEQGAAFEQAIWNIAKTQRAADKQAGTVLEWQQSAADALVTLARAAERAASDGVRRSPTTLIVHLSEDAPPLLEGAGPISPETAERLTCDARRLTIKPSGRDLVHSRVGRCASYAQQRALHKRSARTVSTPAAPPPANSRHTTSPPSSTAARPNSTTSSCSAPATTNCSTTTTSTPTATASSPIFEDEAGRAITTNQPHAPPR